MEPTNDLRQSVIKNLPRESGGATASNRFDFQKNWAICKVLELHKRPSDYLLTLEHHDDIIIFDSSTDPKKISFYQVKTKDGNWTLNQIIKQQKTKSGNLTNSYLGRLYLHLETFDKSVESLNFITNAVIKGKLKGNQKCEETSGFSCDQLEDKELQNLENGLKSETGNTILKDFKKRTFFKLGELDIHQHEIITKGKLSEFIDEQFPDSKYQIAPLYRSIFDEIKMKSNYEREVTDFEGLKKSKSLSRNDVESYLGMISKQNDRNELTKSIENRLNSEMADFKLVKSFNAKAKVYEIKLMNYNDKFLKKTEKKIEQVLSNASVNLSDGLVSSMESVINRLDLSKMTTGDIDLELIKTIVLFKLYE
jgi:hypothetical protein